MIRAHRLRLPAQAGFVLLSALFVMIVLGGMLSIIMKNVTHSNEMVTQAIYHHHVTNTLHSELDLYDLQLHKTKICESQTFERTNRLPSKIIQLKIDCTPLRDHTAFQLKGQAWLNVPQGLVRVDMQKLISQKD